MHKPLTFNEFRAQQARAAMGDGVFYNEDQIVLEAMGSEEIKREDIIDIVEKRLNLTPEAAELLVQEALGRLQTDSSIEHTRYAYYRRVVQMPAADVKPIPTADMKPIKADTVRKAWGC